MRTALKLILFKGVGLFTLTLGGQPMTLSGQYLTLGSVNG